MNHGGEWTVKEDALAYLTVATAKLAESRFEVELQHKLAGNIWWLIVLAERSGIDIKYAVDKFFTKIDVELK
ncbi:hypothetical protein [Pedobacter mendelii]|uniref:MazG-like protein n=1 Tax=Pedobacter mendelii TaxID=1908240 RepID=A0ABQ2BDH7_9SPHI|nr:hypothetical protein [Pedobacter mendelii]GGI23431.1 hypothetical protein GCM10008119_07610 [Pedobacter mendelii]